MIYGLYQSTAGMLTNQYRQAVIANNLANVDTAGFKRDIATFNERLIEAQTRLGVTRHRYLDHMTGGVWPGRTDTDWQQGPLDMTGSGLDAAIVGEGFFAVQTPEGPRYTRMGQFAVDTQNRLVTAQGGWPVLDDRDTEITLPADTNQVRITAGGAVTADGETVARLQVLRFDEPSSLRKVGRGLIASDATGQPIRPELRSGAFERSNVEPMREMVAMIETARAYELNAQFVSLQNETLGRLINQVGKVT